MEIRTKVTKSGNVWQLVNESWSTSRAWGHRTEIIKNGYDYGEHKCRYINRTWERYAFESCMSGAVYELRERELNRFIENYKYTHDIDRFKKGEKEKVIELFKEETIAKDLDEIKEAIELREFDSLKDIAKKIDLES